MIDVHEVLDFILNGEQRDIDLVRKALSLRHKTLTEMREIETVHSIYVGDEVKLTMIRPKYLQGMIGRVESIESDHLEVLLHDYPKQGTRRRNIPFSCVEKY